MTFTITFSHIINGKRFPLYIDGIEKTLQVEADDRSGAVNHPDVLAFCESRQDDCRPRRVSP